MHLATAFELAACRRPEADALVQGDLRLTYGAWHGRVNAAAWRLLQAGIGPGDRVAICAQNGEAPTTLYFAAHRAGATAVWLHPRWKSGELASALRDAAAGAVVYDAFTAPEVPRRAADIATVLYTSGTTGRPKGVARTHQSDCFAALGMIVEHRWRPGSARWPPCRSATPWGCTR